jgi:ABC-2 type transport system permease protein
MNTGRVRHLVRKELRQMFRDPKSKRIIFLAPVVQLLMFGYAVNTDVHDAPVTVVDRDRTQVSREMIQTFTATGRFRVHAVSDRRAAIEADLAHGDALVGLEIPPGFGADLAAGRPAAVQLLVDGTSSNTPCGIRGVHAEGRHEKVFPGAFLLPVDVPGRRWPGFSPVQCQ